MDCTIWVITIKWPSGRICLKTCFANPRLVWLHEVPTTSFVGGYNLYQTVQTMDVCLEYVQGLEQIAPNRNSFANHHVVSFYRNLHLQPTLLKLLNSFPPDPPIVEKGGEFAVKLMWESYVMTADQLQKVRDGSALGRPLFDGPRRPSKCCTALQNLAA